MRRILLAVLVLTASISFAWYSGAPRLFSWVAERTSRSEAAVEPGNWRVRKVPQAQVSIAYVLDREEWLTFDLPFEPPFLRLITSADLPSDERARLPTPLPEDTDWPYAIRYQFLDRAGKILEDRVYHLRSRLSEFANPELGETITPAFYLGNTVIPADGRSLFFNLSGFDKPARLRLRLARADAPLSGVVVRVYHPARTSSFKLRYLWQRYPEGRRQKLARGNVYSPELLTEEEKRNLLKHRLDPLAPVGIPGRDYQQREVYVLREIDGEPVRDRPMPAGLILDGDRRAMIPIPEEGGQVRLEFTRVEPPMAGPAPPKGAAARQITLRWQGKKLTQRSAHTLPWDGPSARWEGPLGGGLLEIEAHDLLVVRAFLTGSDPRKRARFGITSEITPELIYTWSYFVEGEGVEFPLTTTTEPTPVRVDVRQVWPIGSIERSIRPIKISYRMIGANDKVIRQGDLEATGSPSVYDRLQQHRQERLISEPTSYYFAVPPEVSRIRLTATKAAAVVNLFTRPARLMKVTRVPEDYYHDNHDEVAQRSWFLLRAARHEQLELNNRVPLLALQSRPAEDDPYMVEGIYEWQDHVPQGGWRGRSLLVPHEVGTPFRPEALAVTYREVPPNRPVPIRFETEPGRDEIAPSLLLFQEKQTRLLVEVDLDGQPYHRATILDARSEIVLPPFRLSKDGNHVLRVKTAHPARVFVNQHNPGDAQSFVKRTAVCLEKSSLVFDYEKVSSDEELLSLFVFQPLNSSTRTVLRVSLEGVPARGVGPHLTWTLRDRQYDVRSQKGESVVVLGTQRETTDPGQVCFFPVGKDVPPGRYRIRIEPESGPGGFVILARTIPGPYEKRLIFLEHPGAK
jgi:hypothetical protein